MNTIDKKDPDEIQPIFLFSLPRAGSTLTQRVLVSHPLISSAAEPWLLLPLVYAHRRSGIYTEYRQEIAAQGLADFCKGLPHGEIDYLSELRRFVLRLYSLRATKGTRYFLDKTPRYHFIAKDIVRLFPEGRFIFLWRNPLAIIASIIETWGKGRWHMHQLVEDMYDGLDRLICTYTDQRDMSCAVRYEDLLASVDEWKRLFSYLGLEFNESQLEQFSSVSLGGSLGDPTGIKLYESLDKEPLDKWKKVLAGPVRKWWCRRYLNWLGKQRLETMGYDLDALIAGLNSIPPSYGTVLSDLLRMIFSVIYRTVEPAIFRDKLRRLLRRERIYSHF